MFVVFFLCNKRNEIRWFVRELNMTNFRAFILKTCRLSDMRKFGFVQTAKVKHLSVLWSCPYSPKGIRFSCMSTSESCGKSCVSVRAKTSLFIRLTSHLMSMLCFLSDRTFNRQILIYDERLWEVRTDCIQVLYYFLSLVVLIADIQSVLLDWLLYVCPLYHPKYTDLEKRLHGSRRHKFVWG